MKTFKEFILESTCNGSSEGIKCPVHGNKKCPEVKSHNSIEQIAKKHRLEVSFIKNQLKMGIPIEHEHTKDKNLATDIALQHLDEIPDYYTRLKKMESSAKKEHKKFKDVKEETTSDGSLNYEWDSPIHDELERYCPKCKKNEERSECKYGVKFWDLYSYPTKLTKIFKESLDGKSAKDPGYSLKDWFKGGGWVQTGGKYDGKPCAKQPGQTTKPFCRDPDDRASMSKKERSKRSAKKRKEDPNPNRSGSAKIVTKEDYIQEKKGEKDACYNKVKSRYKIWPSAYASGALVKCRKVGADNWGTKTEGYTRIQSRGSTYSILFNWRGRPLSAQMFFPQFTRPTKQQVTYEIRKVYPDAIVLSFNPSIKDPTKPLLFTGDENESRRY